MAQLSKAAFLAKYAALFLDNSTRQISESRMREFRQDIADSFKLSGGVVTADTTGATITLDLGGLDTVMFIGTASFATAKGVVLANSSAGLYIEFVFTITNVAAVITMPNEFLGDTSDPRWNSGDKTITFDYPGRYKIWAEWDGTNWNMDISKGSYA